MGRTLRLPAYMAAASLGLAIAAPSDALTVLQPGYAAAIVKSLPQVQYGDIEVDQAGNVLVATALATGILKIDPTKTVSAWSMTPAYDLALTASGGGYGAGGGQCG